ncbi:Gfo/Idh/MocA family oxidoreductase [Ornithinibacillus hominis]|uniref:Gfo/Idh/MocA family oxidoreductase n=2 Tax=Ornithinibacillus TaxID=484508 RepID=A0A923L4M6_9BACI|nr:Gfo/Idh/MocA family oxidoreductase [Ornithinibacillus hominis]MBC5636356.1 Gfo/Idh/MocA family oxidoreductase [Ornithinibacillus hominis]
MKYTVGLIGCGYIANRHIDTISKIKALDLVAVSDIDESKMDSIMQEYRQLTEQRKEILAYKKYEDLLEDERIDIVIIATVSSLHADMAIQALLHHKHVVLEKPLALSIDDANTIAEVSSIVGKRVLVCHQLRYRPVMSRIKELIEQGALGELYFGVASMRINRSSQYYNSAWKGTWEKDGGMLLNQGVHLIDLLIWFMGDVQMVTGEIDRKLDVKSTEDIALGILTFENGAKGIIEANTITLPNNLGYYLTVFGEKGTISIGGPSFNILERCYLPNPFDTEELKTLLKDNNEHVYMYQHFIDALEKEDEVLLGNEKEAMRSLMTIFALYESAREDKKVSLPIRSFATKEMNVRREVNDP